ncbi:tripartite tricarboxylate transporter substrate binding protein [soil metagenome]
MTSKRRSVLVGLAGASLCAALFTADAQTSTPSPSQDASSYPSRPVRVIVPFPPGGFTDVMARYYSEKLAIKWGHPVIVENRAGASGTIGANAVAKAAPDGLTLLVTVAALTSTPGVMASMPYDTVKDFIPITILSNTQTLLVVKPDSPINSLADLISLGKSRPGGVTYSSAGIGTGGHLMMALLESKAGVTFNHVPYKGSPAGLMAAVTGEVDTSVTSVSSALSLIQSGRIRPIAIGGDKRSALLPHVPTLLEMGLPGVIGVDGWVGLLAPAATPRPIVDRIYQDVMAIMETSATNDVLKRQALDKLHETPDQFAARVATEVRELSAVAREKRIQAE